MTLPEGLLWQRLRGQQAGCKFRRQHPIGPYVADFYCSAARLVVEVDGAAHDNADRGARDSARTDYLTQHGYVVLRLQAADILRDVSAAVAAIAARVEDPLHRADGTVPLPAGGEELP